MLCAAFLVLALVSPAQSQQPQSVSQHHASASSEDQQAAGTKRETESPSVAEQNRPNAPGVEPTSAPLQKEPNEKVRRLAYWSKVQAVGTWGLVVVGFLTGISVVCYTMQAKRQADAMHQQLAAMDRPWVKVTVVLTESFEANSAGARFVGEITLRNVGKSPALRVQYRLTDLVISTDEDDQFGVARARREQEVITANWPDEPDSEHAIFPGESLGPFTVYMGLDEAQILKLGIKDTTSILPLLVGGVRYWSANSQKPHCTPFAYSIAQKRNETPDYAPSVRFGRAYAVGEIRLLSVPGAQRIT
jgi:hypothetical protein